MPWAESCGFPEAGVYGEGLASAWGYRGQDLELNLGT